MTYKLRTYDSKVLADTFAITTQIQAKLDNLIEASEGVAVEDMPPSLVPTDSLYAIVVCYDVMFNMLMAEHLLKDGHIKPSSTIH